MRNMCFPTDHQSKNVCECVYVYSLQVYMNIAVVPEEAIENVCNMYMYTQYIHVHVHKAYIQ